MEFDACLLKSYCHQVISNSMQTFRLYTNKNLIIEIANTAVWIMKHEAGLHSSFVSAFAGVCF